MAERRLTIPGRYDRISEVRELVQAAAQAAGLDDQAQHYCQVAVDEACTNIIEHGYEGEDRGEIDVRCSWVAPGSLVIELRDTAQPFDPDSIPTPDPKLSLDLRSEGGWGVYFIARMMDSVEYRREEEVNILRMTKMQRAENQQP